jgi:hypothetical protein
MDALGYLSRWKGLVLKEVNCIQPKPCQRYQLYLQPKSRRFYVYFSCAGAIDFRKALPYIAEENRHRLHAILVAPAAYISRTWKCKSVVHLICEGDFLASTIFPLLKGNEQLKKSVKDPSVVYLKASPRGYFFLTPEVLAKLPPDFDCTILDIEVPDLGSLFPMADHSFSSKVYESELKKRIKQFENNIKKE